MNHFECSRLSPGDRVQVCFGKAVGRQLAVIVSVTHAGERANVRKYRRRSESWTGVVHVTCAQIIELDYVSLVPSP